jgi:hypothetical protein
VIIVDEVHNLRQLKTEKASAKALEQLIETGEGNRLVLLTATPMYNEPDEIFWLLDMVLRNDKRPTIGSKMSLFKKTGEKNEKAFQTLEQLASEYVSYIKGGSPFTMPVRVSPKMNGVQPLTGVAGLEEIQEWIVPVACGSKQKVATISKAGESEEESMQNLQALNVTYPGGKTGTKGFFSLFSEVDDKDPLQVTYNKRYQDYLYDGSLSQVAPKLANIVNIVERASGIVIVYSQFVYGGVLPLAVALEHMGCTRYGVRNVSKGIGVASGSKLAGMSYAIISGDRRVMGAAHIEDILATVNSDANMNGTKVKVVLITPIAGEGLNFKHVREVHILDPWYHMNRIEQVIGRAARTCSHSLLPLEERNVSIYMHACVTDKGDTMDIHAYKIATRKLKQTLSTEQVIRNAALDCSLMHNLNHFSKSLFAFKFHLNTSQGKAIDYQFGDDESTMPVCKHLPAGRASDKTFRRSLYSGIVATLEKRLHKFINKGIEKGTVYFPITQLVELLKVEPEIALTAIQNVATYSNVRLHMNNLVVLKDAARTTVTEVAVPSEEVRKQADEVDDAKGCMLPVITGDVTLDTIMLYMSIDSKCWGALARDMVSGQNPEAAALLAREGALITRSELPRIQTNSKYVGFCDIFDTTKLTAVICPSGGEPRSATDAEIRQLKSARRELKPPDDGLYGMLYPTKFSKDPSQPFNNKLKIFKGDANVRGAMCETKKVTELSNILKELTGKSVDISGKTRYKVCFTISATLFKNSKLLTYPLFKPAKI